MQSSNSNQYLRRWSLLLGQSSSNPAALTPTISSPSSSGQGGGVSASKNSQVLSQDTPGLDLRITFKIRQASIQTPNTAEIRVYNLSDDTARNVINEFDYCTLQAGYQTGGYGIIFSGTIKQYKRGHENAVDSYLEIFAADGDKAVHDAVVNQSLPAGATAQDRLNAISNAFAQKGVTKGYVDTDALKVPPNIRDSVLFGSAADHMRELAQQNGATWSINDGKLTFLGDTSYAPGDIVVLNANSGLVGWPEQTQDGILVTCLINPAIRLLQRIRLDNSQINRFNIPGGAEATAVNFPGWASNPQLSYAVLSADGIYSPLVIDYEGDSRGNPWYQTMNCLSVDPSLDRSGAVPAGRSTTLPASVTTNSIIAKGGT